MKDTKNGLHIIAFCVPLADSVVLYRILCCNLVIDIQVLHHCELSCLFTLSLYTNSLQQTAHMYAFSQRCKAMFFSRDSADMRIFAHTIHLWTMLMCFLFVCIQRIIIEITFATYFASVVFVFWYYFNLSSYLKRTFKYCISVLSPTYT